MSGDQIDRLCRDWLSENYREELVSEYTSYSLVIPMWNAPELSDALETLRWVLCLAFGPTGSFGTTDYHEARRKLSLSDDKVPIPDVFVIAFAVSC